MVKRNSNDPPRRGSRSSAQRSGQPSADSIDSASVDQTSADGTVEMAGLKIVGRLKLYFAILVCLGGAVLAAGSDTEILPAVAIFFAVFGYVFVDWLRLFALPPVAGYTLMAIVAVFCVSDFTDIDQGTNHQMMSVAQLLVLVQSILMMQQKTRRIFEQLAVFCLLELVVAAVFNNALSFGIILIPIALVGAFAFTLLATLHATDGLTSRSLIDGENPSAIDPWSGPSEPGPSEPGFSEPGFSEPGSSRSGAHASSRGPSSSRRLNTAQVAPSTPIVSVRSATSLGSLGAAHRRLPRMTFLALAPAVFLIGVVFFYALPRTTDAAVGEGAAMVGFSEELTLEQIGQMNINPKVALRVRLNDRRNDLPYRVNGPLYLRGKVLENYQASFSMSRNTARWSAHAMPMGVGAGPLPPEFIPERSSDRNFYDPVDVQVTTESRRTGALFVVAPFHRKGRSDSLIQLRNRNTVAQPIAELDVYPRITYRFGTNAFRGGDQTRWMAHMSDWSIRGRGLRIGEMESLTERESAQKERFRLARQSKLEQDYLQRVLQFDSATMPTAAKIAERFVRKPSGQRRSDFEIAKSMELYFATSGDFEYTLALDHASVRGLDPIEQFLSIDRSGHCQYFSSALAMGLRSVGIPTRMVVGFSTDEFNALSDQYIARGSHAHAWVEALISRDQLPRSAKIYGQPVSDFYWVRLDPTPASRRQINAEAGGVGQVLDLAQNMWDDYVVDMDGQRQNDAFLGNGTNPMHQSYRRMLTRMSLMISRIRAGELGGGSLADGGFSGVAAISTAVIAVLGVIMVRFWPSRQRRGKQGDGGSSGPQPAKLQFYGSTLEQLGRIGVHRHDSQTPDELRGHVSNLWQHPMLPSLDGPMAILTAAYYRLRFGKEPAGDSAATDPDIDNALQSLKQVIDSAPPELDLFGTDHGRSRSDGILKAGSERNSGSDRSVGV